MEFFNPPGWPRPKGYSNAIKASGDMVFLAGLVGWNDQEEFTETTFAGQARQIFENALALLKEANAGPEHIARMTWYITDKQEYLDSLAELGVAYRETIGRHFPVMAVVQVAGLIEDGAKLEIEMTAMVPST